MFWNCLFKFSLRLLGEQTQISDVLRALISFEGDSKDCGRKRGLRKVKKWNQRPGNGRGVGGSKEKHRGQSKWCWAEWGDAVPCRGPLHCYDENPRWWFYMRSYRGFPLACFLWREKLLFWCCQLKQLGWGWSNSQEDTSNKLLLNLSPACVGNPFPPPCPLAHSLGQSSPSGGLTGHLSSSLPLLSSWPAILYRAPQEEAELPGQLSSPCPACTHWVNVYARAAGLLYTPLCPCNAQPGKEMGSEAKQRTPRNSPQFRKIDGPQWKCPLLPERGVQYLARVGRGRIVSRKSKLI